MSEKYIERVGLSLALNEYKQREENKREKKQDKSQDFESIFKPLILE